MFNYRNDMILFENCSRSQGAVCLDDLVNLADYKPAPKQYDLFAPEPSTVEEKHHVNDAGANMTTVIN